MFFKFNIWRTIWEEMQELQYVGTLLYLGTVEQKNKEQAVLVLPYLV